MTKERELLRRVVKDWDSDSLSNFVITMDEIEAYLAAEEIDTSPEPKPAIGARLPNGAVVTNVYEAYEEGLKQRGTELNLNCKSVRKRLAYQWGFVPRTEQEPVAWRCCMPGQEPILLHDEPSDERYPPGYKDPLYYSPSPQAEQRKLLSEEEIDKAYMSEMNAGSWYSFFYGVRFAEKHHGIGEGDGL